MAIGEFELIRRFFKADAGSRKDVALGIGDDAAVLTIPEGQQVVVTVDTLVENIHFYPDVAPEDLAHKALAVNLSDLAAMGAQPSWITLSLTIPEVNENWLERFSQTIHELCHFYDVQLIGGDTCRGHLSVSVQAMGLIPAQASLKRSNARVGDLIYVTGTLGDAGAGLSLIDSDLTRPNNNQQFLLSRLHRPTPRLEAGILLRQLANAAIDISDGLVQDIRHILDASNVGALVEINQLPLSPAMQAEFSANQGRSFAMTAGDDYELCFTISPDQQAKVERVFATASTPITRIGRITATKGLSLRDKEQSVVNVKTQGFDHFTTTHHELSNS